MTNSPSNTRSEENGSLIAFSDQLATIAERAGASIVAMNGRRRRSSSGVYWRPGIIVTAEHAIGRDDEITVTLPDDRTETATLIGRDAGTDLAVLRLNEDTPALQVATVGDSTTLKVGHMVLAIARGSDSGVAASFGVISAIGGTWRSWHGGRIDQFIRPSVMLYPGFSGSALVDTQGQVVGINTAGPRHMALTIPASTVNRVVDRVLQGGSAQRGFLGLGMQSVELPRALLDRLHLSNRQGVIVVSVEPDGPAEQAGVLLGDILIALGGSPISDVGDVHNLLDPEQVGQPLAAQIIRGGALLEITITVGERPHQTRG
ncbi:MAG: S1C family serine protease [Lyngbya sp. HA4199-MV5]|jgi:S1-C subfamily serine protease|nr:S1C family serine protease [Lyngbya sp. HA4199-MV5]